MSTGTFVLSPFRRDEDSQQKRLRGPAPPLSAGVRTRCFRENQKNRFSQKKEQHFVYDLLSGFVSHRKYLYQYRKTIIVSTLI